MRWQKCKPLRSEWANRIKSKAKYLILAAAAVAVAVVVLVATLARSLFTHVSFFLFPLLLFFGILFLIV